MRISRLFTILLVCIGVVFFLGCEGPEGAAGADGADGMDGADGADGEDGHVTCLGCHNDETFNDNAFEFARSQHIMGEYAGYAGGRSYCTPCHSHEAYVEYATTGTNAGGYNNPSPFECATCHSLHADFEEDFTGEDAALRLTDPVMAMFDETVSLELDDTNANMCVMCHQSRRGTDYYDDGTGTTVTFTSSHTGPHHGPQSNILLGNNGSVVGEAMDHAEAGCIACHMFETEGDEADVAGGHTFWAAVEACQECHSSAEDFDVFGNQTNITTKLETLADLLVGEGILDSTHHVVPGTYDRAVFNAFWDYDIVYEDRSKGVHNPGYAEDLLDAAIANVDGVPN